MGKAAKAVLAVLVLAGAAAGISYATNAITQTATSTLQACANGTNGNLRLVSSPGDCRTNETAVSWNVIGPAGPPGPAGQDGTNGANGKDGANGVSPTVAQLSAGDANCPTGGASITDAAGTVGYVCNGAKGEPGASGTPFSGTFTSPNGLFSIHVSDLGVELRSPAAKVTLDSTTLKLEADASMTVRAGANLDIRGGGIASVEGGGQLRLGSGSCATPLRVVDPMFVNVPGGGAGGAFPVTVAATGVTDVCIG